MNLRVLITGGAGYLGSILSERLLNGPYDVTVVDNLMYGQHGLFHLCAHPRFDFVNGDVRDEKLIGVWRKRLTSQSSGGDRRGTRCDRDPCSQSPRIWRDRMLNRLRSPSRRSTRPPIAGMGPKPRCLLRRDTPLEPISLRPNQGRRA
jgi:hypothetical protein